jgi:hypothetical protein
MYPGCVKEINHTKQPFLASAPYASHLPLLEYPVQHNSNAAIPSVEGEMGENSHLYSDIYEESTSSSRTTTITSENNIFLKSSCGQGSVSTPMRRNMHDSNDEQLGFGPPGDEYLSGATTKATSTIPKAKHRKLREYLSHNEHDAMGKGRAVVDITHTTSSSSGITSVNSPGVRYDVGDTKAMSISNTCSSILTTDRMMDETGSLLEDVAAIPTSSSSNGFIDRTSIPPSLTSSIVNSSSSSSYLKVESVSESIEEPDPSPVLDSSAKSAIITNVNETKVLVPEPSFLNHAEYLVLAPGLPMRVSEDVLAYILSLEQTIVNQRRQIDLLAQKNEQFDTALSQSKK